MNTAIWPVRFGISGFTDGAGSARRVWSLFASGDAACAGASAVTGASGFFSVAAVSALTGSDLVASDLVPSDLAGSAAVSVFAASVGLASVLAASSDLAASAVFATVSG